MQGRERRRFKREVLRRRAKQEHRAADTRVQQVQAEMRRAFRRQRRRKVWAGALVTTGAIIGVSHWLQHLGAYTLLDPGLADLLIGYPMSGALIVAGLIVLGR